MACMAKADFLKDTALKIQKKEHELLEKEISLFEIDKLIVEKEKKKDEIRLTHSEQILFDKQYKNQQQRELALKKALETDTTFLNLQKEIEGLKEKRKSTEFKIKKTKIEISYFKRLYEATITDMKLIMAIRREK